MSPPGPRLANVRVDAELVARAEEALNRSVRNHDQLFAAVLNAAMIGGGLECVVIDTAGWLWICREEYDFSFLDEQYTGARALPYLMPVSGPCPLSMRALPDGAAAGLIPEGECTARVDLLCEARHLLKAGRGVRAA